MEPPESLPELKIDTHRALAANVKEICRRLNANPDIAKLLFVNPVYALEDLGVRLNAEMRTHVVDTLRNPPARQRRLAALEVEIKAEVEKVTGRAEIPRSPEDRAELLFRRLNLAPHELERGATASIAPDRLRAYGSQHPLVARLVEYDALQRAGLVFLPREIYQSYKRGDRKQCWVDSITFQV